MRHINFFACIEKSMFYRPNSLNVEGFLDMYLYVCICPSTTQHNKTTALLPPCMYVMICVKWVKKWCLSLDFFFNLIFGLFCNRIMVPSMSWCSLAFEGKWKQEICNMVKVEIVCMVVFVKLYAMDPISYANLRVGKWVSIEIYWRQRGGQVPVWPSPWCLLFQ